MKQFLIIAFTVVFIGIVLLIIVAKDIEGVNLLQKYWEVEAIYVNDRDVSNEYPGSSLSFLADGKALLPKRNDYKASLPLFYSKWKHERKGVFDGIIKIEDTKQSIFTGEYEIEVIQYNNPKLIMLYSDSIKIRLRGKGDFSVDNHSIDLKFGDSRKSKD